jgi:CRISPR/Cas system-associated exonuclease Cas4 (RecB family)
MSDSKWGYKRSSKVYVPGATTPFRLSRSKIQGFLDCPCCFYLDRRLGVGRPSMPQFNLNLAVDHLLKKEFDAHRKESMPHPLMEQYGIDAVPFDDPRMEKWRENFVGVERLHEPTNFMVFGAIDDLWVDSEGKVMVVDYKATSKDEIIDRLSDTKWHDQYRRQMEMYQWLLRGNRLDVSDTGYFVYVNAMRHVESFDGKLEFDVRIIAHEGKADWIEDTLVRIKECLDNDAVPAPAADCEYCAYRRAARDAQTEMKKTT